MAKRERATKRQIEDLISFVEKEKEIIFGGNFPEWEELQVILNNIEGPKRSIEQWKSVLNDLKTNCKRKARINAANLKQTGGGPWDTKPLSDMENRILLLLNKTVIESLHTVPAVGLEEGIRENATLASSPVVDILHDTEEAISSNIAVELPPRPKKRRKAIPASRTTPFTDENLLRNLISSNNNIVESNNNIASVINALSKVIKRKK